LASDSSALTPDEAVARAMARSDEVRAAWLNVEVARVEETAVVLESPQLQLGHRSLNAVGDQVDPFNDTQVGVSWQVPKLEDLGLRQAIGGHNADANVLKNVDDLVAAVAVEVRLLHARILSLRAEAALAKERVTLLEQVAALQTRRVAEQLATSLDTGLTRLELLSALADLTDVTSDLMRAEQRLGRLLAEQLPLSLVPASTPLCALPARPFAELVEDARQRSPRLQSLVQQEEALRLREARAWLRYVPWVDGLQVGSVTQGTTPELRARLDIAIPIFEPLSPEHRVIALEHTRLAAERRVVERDIEERLSAAVDQLTGFVRMVELYAASTSSIDENQALVARSLEAEVVDTLRVATVQERVVTARRQALRSRSRCDEAGIAFMAAAGAAVPPSVAAAARGTVD
jgi:outer membrane protein TolC